MPDVESAETYPDYSIADNVLSMERKRAEKYIEIIKSEIAAEVK